LRLFIEPRLFDPPTCRRIRAAMDAGTPEPSEVLGSDMALDEEVRRAAHVDIDAMLLQVIEDRLDAAAPAIGRFYGLRLTEREGTSLLRYPAGGFYKPHRDYAVNAAWPGAARRRIAVVVFLASSRDEEPSGLFDGGWLRLLPDDGEPLDLRPRQGTLVAFPADTLHEVTVVGSGRRDTLVDWFY
jgi:predicted 2-oxoglutarate/Fe(II)-dependent dioxygenase YbiX